MLVKILGIVDLFIVIGIIISSMLSPNIIVIFALYLMLKGLIFAIIGDKMSLIELMIGFYVLSLTYGISHWIITTLVVIYLLQKGVVSIFS